MVWLKKFKHGLSLDPGWPVDPMESEELIENLVVATNQSRGSVQAVLSELDVQVLPKPTDRPGGYTARRI